MLTLFIDENKHDQSTGRHLVQGRRSLGHGLDDKNNFSFSTPLQIQLPLVMLASGFWYNSSFPLSSKPVLDFTVVSDSLCCLATLQQHNSIVCREDSTLECAFYLQPHLRQDFVFSPPSTVSVLPAESTCSENMPSSQFSVLYNWKHTVWQRGK